MPCKNCLRTLIIYNEKKLCPTCDNLALLDSITAIAISERIYDYLNNLFYNRLKEWNTRHLITYCVTMREQKSRQFFQKYSPFPIGGLSKYTILAVNILKNSYNPNGKTIVIDTDEQEVKNLFNIFEKLAEFENHPAIKDPLAKHLELTKQHTILIAQNEKRFHEKGATPGKSVMQ